MSKGILLDTSVIIPHLRRDSSISEKLADADPLYVPVVVVGELMTGAYLLPFPEQQLAKIKLFLKAVAVLGIGLTTADEFGQITASLRESGRNIPTNDAWVAAVAREHDMPLAARDEHFTRVQGLNLVAW